MKSTAVTLAALAIVVLAISTNIDALRQRGQPYVGLANIDVRPNKNYRSSSRIVGGGDVQIDSAPWQVSIQNQYGNHFCGGAIIDDQYVLTSASCVSGLQKKNIKIITSTSDWMNEEGCYYNVSQIITHCNFDKPINHNDIALLKTETFFLFSEKLQKIPIAQEDLVRDGDKLTMTGWGSTKKGEFFSAYLQKLDGKYVPYDECKFKLGYTNSVDIGHLCSYTKKGEGICHGDAGAPLVNENKELVGIANWGIACAEGYPDVFARVAFYNDWIRTSIKGCYYPR